MIANAIAKRDHVIIKPTGISALNKLGCHNKYIQSTSI